MSDFGVGPASPNLGPNLGKPESEVGIIGPAKGFALQIGVLVSMMAFIRVQVFNCVKGMSVTDLDFLLDPNANTIGATLLHLAAAESYCQLNTFDEMEWDSWPQAIKDKWDVAMSLGEPARQAIKGNSLDYYLTVLNGVREKTLSEFQKRDDQWLAAVDAKWGWNNHAKWFHVAEHESNHNGQFKFLRTRLRPSR